jgi:hypothetical protein
MWADPGCPSLAIMREGDCVDDLFVVSTIAFQPLFALLVLRSRQGRTSHFARAETGLRGWAFRIRTGESVRELSDWNCVTTSPDVGASPAAETLRVQAA